MAQFEIAQFETAQMLAIQVLSWLAGQPDQIGAFMAQSGLDPAELRGRASEPEFLASVLDFLLADEPTLLAFCHDAGVAPTAPLQARAALPGGDLPHWT